MKHSEGRKNTFGPTSVAPKWGSCEQRPKYRTRKSCEIAQTCEEFERAVRQMLAVAAVPEEEAPAEDEEEAAQGAQEDEEGA